MRAEVLRTGTRLRQTGSANVLQAGSQADLLRSGAQADLRRSGVQLLRATRMLLPARTTSSQAVSAEASFAEVQPVQYVEARRLRPAEGLCSQAGLQQTSSQADVLCTSTQARTLCTQADVLCTSTQARALCTQADVLCTSTQARTLCTQADLLQASRSDLCRSETGLLPLVFSDSQGMNEVIEEVFS